ncbi:thermonuclease family protein [Ancylobacter sp. 6x-1]|uniref:Thermonuclease family protein n=1 Tax=Ancylobacter crimeensis TaxID=2579147 RepID=A0ABT0DEC4_9HYPH|nr:thermonuclease family protein [Ancylobacter crimeensis]MCK0198092.1 thermonuclease family protein [Ancylobacter crimeensis]
MAVALLLFALPGPARAEAACGGEMAGTAQESPQGSPQESSIVGQIVRRVEGSDLRLADGRLVRLAGIVAQDEGGVPGLPADGLAGHRVSLTVLDVPDRYGRLVALVQTGPDEGAAGLQVRLLEQGLAVLAPDSVPAGCRTRLVEAERRGRIAQAGVWQVFPLDARDAAALARFSGRFAVLAGEVVRVGRTQARDYLDFGRQWRKDVTVEVPRASRAAFSGAGKDSQRLVMHRIEARGLIFASGGPALEAWTPEQMDDVEPAAAREGRAGRILTREGDEP